MKIKIGCCGFPSGKENYFREFKLVEVQETFYKLPKIETAEKWRTLAPEDFEFMIKAWQAITHPSTSPTWRKAGIKIEPKSAERYGNLKPTSEVFDAWNHTKRIADTLKSKIVVIQCPPSFICSKENIENAKEFFKSISRGNLQIAWEPRGNWLEKPGEVRRLCDEFNLIHAVDIFWDKPVSANPVSYIRLHGLERRYNYRYVYTSKDLKNLFDKVQQLKGKKEIYVLFNNIAMQDSSDQFRKMLTGIGMRN